MPTGPIEPDLTRLGISDTDRSRLSFLVLAHGLTGIERLNRLIDGSRAETSAEHSWHLALTAYVLRDYGGAEVQLERVIEMLVIHDVIEVEAGDVPIYDEAARAAVVEAEERAARRLFGVLPAPDATAYLQMWHEFEAAETADARFARALDRLQPILVHWSGGGVVWRERGISELQERRLIEVIERYWAPLAPLATALIDDAVARGLLT